MTSDEILKKRAACLQNIQHGISMIEQLKGRVAQERGRLGVFDELLLEMGVDPNAPSAEFEPDGEETNEEEATA